MDRKFLYTLVSTNAPLIISIIVAVTVIYLFIDYFFISFTIEDVKIVLAISGTLFSISVATVSFYSRHFDEKIQWLFESVKKFVSTELEAEVRKGAGQIFSHLTFLYGLFLVIIPLLGTALFMSLLIVVTNALYLAKLDTFLFMSAILILVLWMLSFITWTLPTSEAYEDLTKISEAKPISEIADPLHVLQEKFKETRNEIKEIKTKFIRGEISEEELTAKRQEIKQKIEQLKKKVEVTFNSTPEDDSQLP